MDYSKYLLYLLVMVVVTYLIRVVPYALMRKEIKSVFFKSFMEYVPSAVLAAMTFPAIIYATDNPVTGMIGLVAAVICAFIKPNLLLVASTACVAVFISGLFLG